MSNIKQMIGTVEDYDDDDDRLLFVQATRDLYGGRKIKARRKTTADIIHGVFYLLMYKSFYIEKSDRLPITIYVYCLMYIYTYYIAVDWGIIKV